MKYRIIAIVILLLGGTLGYFVYQSQVDHQAGAQSRFAKYPFKLGLDLKGGSHLVYRADTKNLVSNQIDPAMSALREVIENRINAIGVAEPAITTQKVRIGENVENRLIVDLPGVTDVKQAIAQIGETPTLDFRVEDPNYDPNNLVGTVVDGEVKLEMPDQFIKTQLTGAYLKSARAEFDQQTGEPYVAITFNKEGADLFEKITGENVGKRLAIYLDGVPLSIPTVNEKITGGQAVINGQFTPKQAKDLAERLNFGALPVNVELISTQTIGASLGEAAVTDGVKAAIIGFLLVAIFLIFWYRLPGLISIISLSIYALIVMSIFKLIPVTLTAAGIAGFIISIGTAVDANILIFERMKEELRGGKEIPEAIQAGFGRAWTSIRDANIASILVGIVLMSTGIPIVRGFAVTLIIGMLISLFSAMTVSRLMMYALRFKKSGRIVRFMFNSGFSK
ncbi:protein-export membrane protein SecD [Candidatus Nomurabacteria bacterium RIFCSPHIGHO2_02_FULL_38_15]|uniref:Protein translocase subunit SecD n=1 Tax=Candidatus Nomurabacteria bacterium RIFCSPHIGHO2_02_FULL_38_15 TaxID=1801752 RepID=A0A1F6VRI0_9BACT|nr:MAG: protein-export membrane protein SecD [Candidatus Nomurabacteria bacterium RIFCSPHIGHO2_02_FULL_38_15]